MFDNYGVKIKFKKIGIAIESLQVHCIDENGVSLNIGFDISIDAYNDIQNAICKKNMLTISDFIEILKKYDIEQKEGPSSTPSLTRKEKKNLKGRKKNEK